MTLFAAVVDAATVVGATTKRTEKKAALAALLGTLEPTEIEVVVGFLIGELRQGRIGVGWATVRDLPSGAGTEPSITIADVDRTVTDVAATTGPGSQAARTALLGDLIQRATPPETDFIGRLFTGELRTGALAGVVTDAVAAASGVKLAAVRRAAMLAGDLPSVARIALVDGADAVAAIGLRPLQPVQPMLASTSESVEAAVAEVGEASVEWKLDGARIQVHRVGQEVRIFTRNLNEVTARLPEVVDAVRRYSAHSFVLDGEVLGFLGPAGSEPEGHQTPRAFQDTMSRFGRSEAATHPTRLTPHFFDILHLDGADLIDDPLRARRGRLAALVGDDLIPGQITADAALGDEVLAQALARGHEGVMVKAAASPYDAGRRGKSWRKVKPVHTLDLVVLAVEWGSGRRRGTLSNIHLGARDPSTGDFVMVGKTFKGMTDEMLAWQTERFLALEVRRTEHVVWVRPEQVVEIALDGAQVSTRYPGGVALRFARVRRYREDKAPEEADTLAAVRSLLHGGNPAETDD